jgi:hypothetical protein
MPRAPAHSRKRYIDGVTVVLDWELEQALVHGRTMFGPLRLLQRRDDWRRAWIEWRHVILPKALEHRPGLRPFALYAIGEIEPRELRLPLPAGHGWTTLEIPDNRGRITTHYVDVPEPYIEDEARHLHRLGIVDDGELRRHDAWLRTLAAHGDRCTADSYPLEASLYE